jgi:cation diffusion facilitator CzcD-associated flavoprotein CzcO
MLQARRPTPQIVIVGAGFGGLAMAIALVRAGIRSFTILERASGLGGTWRDNTYPGAACDVPSHLYSFSFAPKHDWSRAYSEQPEILAYLQACAKRYGLADHIRYNADVIAATYDDARERWRIDVARGEPIEADIFISACGQLNRPAYPAIPGRERFAGDAFHSARWSHDVDLRGKRVAVIGTGASAVQFVPQIAPLVDSLTLFQRSAAYVIPKADRAYGRIETLAFRFVPFLQRLNRLRKYLEHETRVIAFAYFKALTVIPLMSFRKHLKKQVTDATLRKTLEPAYAIGCKRVMISNDYFPALARPNVEIVSEKIERISETGIVTADGRERAFDAIVFGTGFDATHFLVPMRVLGRDGRDLHEAWRGGAHAYLGIVVPGFPNFFMIYGPNTNLGHNSIVYMIESQVRYVMSAIAAYERGNAPLEVRADVERTFNERVQKRIGKSVWAAGCDSWYINGSGHNANNWPEFTFEYRRRTRAIDLADFEPVRG